MSAFRASGRLQKRVAQLEERSGLFWSLAAEAVHPAGPVVTAFSGPLIGTAKEASGPGTDLWIFRLELDCSSNQPLSVGASPVYLTAISWLGYI